MDRGYVETSVWGMVPPGQNAALRQPTLEFLDRCERQLFIACISDVVANEIRQAPEKAQEAILQRMALINPVILPIPPEADALAQRFIDDGILPPRRLDDARHVACALVNEVELLVSWNYRHIANVRKAKDFNAIAVLAGLKAGLEIHTPLEVLGWK
jgi:hypothetical protein